jgi:hypothetical protein
MSLRIHIGGGMMIGSGGKSNYPWYGIRIDDSNSSPDVERIASSLGAMDLHISTKYISTCH